MKKYLLLFLFIPFIVLGSEKKHCSEIQQLEKLLAFFESSAYKTFEQDPFKKDFININKALLALGTPLLQYPKMKLSKPLEIIVNGKAIHLTQIETNIGSGVAKHYGFITGSKQYRESDGTPWERKDFMAINIEKSGQVKPPLFSRTDTYMCLENGYH
ncbi:MAG TPA: hypothetical protein VFF04_01875 [Candidatus Babeliales bacterium]|nr:hypothetical protein [Candidatus Babeliales bacterium]